MNAVPLIAMIFGWPAVFAGALLGSPFLLYLFATPRVSWLSLPVAVLSFGSAQAVAQSHRALALAMAMPFMLLAGLVAWVVLRQ
jgi:hypothetical protein